MKKRSGIIYLFLIATMLGLGALIVEGFAIVFLEQTFRSYFATDPAQSLGFTNDGEPYLETWNPVSRNMVCTDLEGKPIEVDPYRGGGASLAPGIDYWSKQRWPWQGRISQYSVDERRVPVSLWYLMHDAYSDGGSYFVGYSATAFERIGYIGTAGFSRDPLPRAQWFAVVDKTPWYTKTFENDGEDVSYVSVPYSVALNCGSKVFSVDLETHEVRIVVDDLPLPILSITTVAKHRHSYLAMLTDKEIYLIDNEGKRQAFPLPAELQQRPLSFAMRPDGSMTVAVPQPRIFGSADNRESVFVLAADGTLSGRRDVTLSGNQYDSGTSFLALFGSPMPESIVLLASSKEWQHYEGVQSLGQYQRLLLWRDRWWILAATLEAAVLAALCFRRQTRFRLSLVQRILWPVFVFVFGFPGWIGYLYCRRWPVLEPCPACHQPSPRNDEVCAVCGQEFPLPALKGTEIFA